MLFDNPLQDPPSYWNSGLEILTNEELAEQYDLLLQALCSDNHFSSMKVEIERRGITFEYLETLLPSTIIQTE